MDSALKSQFLSLYCMVLADGVIDARELEILYKIGIEQYGLSQTDIVECVKNAGSSFVLPETLEGKIRFLVNMAQIAFADGEVDSTERSLLEKYIRKMNFEEANVKDIADFLLGSVEEGKGVDEIVKCATEN